MEEGGRHEHEPAIRTRWAPKAEQIMILESIFNGGMVNPPKDETVRIRKLLEKFGPVADANIFYWFQNRRSRSRRLRQRQLLQAQEEPAAAPPANTDYVVAANSSAAAAASLNYAPPPPDHAHFDQSGYMTVFVNGVPTEVPRGPIELKSMFGEDVILVHSTGVPLPTNEHGVLQHNLQPGQTYFLVPRPSINSQVELDMSREASQYI